MKINRRTLFLLSLLTLLGLSGIGLLLILWLQEHTIVEIFTYGSSLYVQIPLGLVYGIAGAVVGILLISQPWFENEVEVFEEIISKVNPQFYHIVFYSFCAGVGEEILFRAGIQPLLGVWWTAFLFIALHGYLNPFNLFISIYGALMVFISAGFGYLFYDHGIYTAMAAHFSFDVVMFMYLKKTVERKQQDEAAALTDEGDSSLL